MNLTSVRKKPEIWLATQNFIDLIPDAKIYKSVLKHFEWLMLKNEFKKVPEYYKDVVRNQRIKLRDKFTNGLSQAGKDHLKQLSVSNTLKIKQTNLLSLIQQERK